MRVTAIVTTNSGDERKAESECFRTVQAVQSEIEKKEESKMNRGAEPGKIIFLTLQTIVLSAAGRTGSLSTGVVLTGT